MQSLLFWIAIVVTAAVSLAVLPGLEDSLIGRLPSTLRTFVPLWFLWGLSDAVVLPKELIMWTAAPLLFALGLICRIRERGGTTPLEQVMWFMAFLYLWLVAASVSASVYPAAGWEALAIQAATICAGLGVAGGLDHPRLCRLLAWSVGIGVLIALYALAQHLDIDPMAWTPHSLVVTRSIGTLGNPDYLASYLVVLLPLCVLPLARTDRPPSMAARFCLGLAAGVILVATIFTYTRGAWVASVVEGLILGGFWRSPGRQSARLSIRVAFWLALLLVALPVGGYLWATEKPTAHQNDLVFRVVGTFTPADYSTATRVSLWRESLQIMGHAPLLGTGPDTFSYAYMPYRFYDSALLKARVALPGDPHNSLLEIAVSSGIPAACLVVGLFALALGRLCWCAFSEEPDGEAVCLLAALAGFYVAHQFVRVTVPNAWSGWLLVGAGIAWARRDGSRTTLSRTHAVAQVLVAIAGLLATLATGAVSLRMFRADFQFNLGKQLGQQLGSATAPIDTARLTNVLRCFDAALQGIPDGPRRVAVLKRTGQLLEDLYAHTTPVLRRGDAEKVWRAVRTQARARYKEALRVNPLDPYSWQALGRFLVMTARNDLTDSALDVNQRRRAGLEIEEGMQASRHGCKLDPYNARLWGDHAVRCAIIGLDDEARDAFERSLALAPQFISTRLDYARLLVHEKRAQQAREQLEEVLAREPDNGDAKEMLAEIH